MWYCWALVLVLLMAGAGSVPGQRGSVIDVECQRLEFSFRWAYFIFYFFCKSYCQCEFFWHMFKETNRFPWNFRGVYTVFSLMCTKLLSSIFPQKKKTSFFNICINLSLKLKFILEYKNNNFLSMSGRQTQLHNLYTLAYIPYWKWQEWSETGTFASSLILQVFVVYSPKFQVKIARKYLPHNQPEKRQENSVWKWNHQYRQSWTEQHINNLDINAWKWQRKLCNSQLKQKFPWQAGVSHDWKHSTSSTVFAESPNSTLINVLPSS